MDSEQVSNEPLLRLLASRRMRCRRKRRWGIVSCISPLYFLRFSHGWCVPKKTTSRNRLAQISPHGCLCLSRRQRRRRRRTGTVSKIYLSHSSLRIFRKRCRTRPLTEAVSGKSVLILSCVSSADDAEQNDEQEEYQTKNSPRRFLQLFHGRGRVR